MPIAPETKNWLWVLERRCEECRFDASSVDAYDVAALARRRPGVWERVLSRPGVGTRPSDDRWSPLEYGCHVRDVFRLAHYRVSLMVDEDEPTFADWDQDETATTAAYGSQGPTTVAGELGVAATAFAALLDGLPDTAWARRGSRSDGARFTIASFARYVIHDPVHHEMDVAAGP